MYSGDADEVAPQLHGPLSTYFT